MNYPQYLPRVLLKYYPVLLRSTDTFLTPTVHTCEHAQKPTVVHVYPICDIKSAIVTCLSNEPWSVVESGK